MKVFYLCLTDMDSIQGRIQDLGQGGAKAVKIYQCARKVRAQKLPRPFSGVGRVY